MLNARQLTLEATARRQSDGGGAYDRGHGAANTYHRAVAVGGTIERPARAGARMSACERMGGRNDVEVMLKCLLFSSMER